MKNSKTQNIEHKLEIVQKDAPILREVARSVPVENIGSKEIQGIIERMKHALAREEDGVAIAAPQIGESLRIFVVSGKILRKETDPDDYIPESMVFINPEIVNRSRKKAEMEEGCLSVRWFYGWVKRSEKVTIRAYNEEGNRVDVGGSGLMAQIFQHEVDHLNGILFTDKARDLEKMIPEEKHE